jgi:hypothetical protein
MESALLYKMTIWSGPTYDEVGGRGVLTIEAYFKVALWDSIRENRNGFLPRIGIPFIKDWIAEEFGLHVSPGDLKVRFEREEPAETEDEEIAVDFRVITYRGKGISAQSYPQQIIPLESYGSGYDHNRDDESGQHLDNFGSGERDQDEGADDEYDDERDEDDKG